MPTPLSKHPEYGSNPPPGYEVAAARFSPAGLKGAHRRPDGGECAYLADVFCNKCGWLASTVAAGRWQPSAVSALALGLLIGAVVGSLLGSVLTLLLAGR